HRLGLIRLWRTFPLELPGRIPPQLAPNRSAARQGWGAEASAGKVWRRGDVSRLTNACTAKATGTPNTAAASDWMPNHSPGPLPSGVAPNGRVRRYAPV